MRKALAPKHVRSTKEPYPSSPKFPPEYHLYFEFDNKLSSFSFSACFSAKKFIDYVALGSDGVFDGESLTFPSGIVVRGANLDDIIDYEYTRAEDAWEITEPQLSLIVAFMYGKVEFSESSLASSTERRFNREKRKLTRRKMTTIIELAEELKVKPRFARGVLRESEIEKPEHGWAWDNESLPAIRELILSKIS